MKRKIIKQGHNTLTITLPSSWTKRLNVQAGKEIDIIERDNGLFITTEKNSNQNKTEFDISDMDIPTMWKYFMSVYREGYDEVKVKFHPNLKIKHPYKYMTKNRLDKKYGTERETENLISALQIFVDRFIGFEIIDHGKDYILIKEMGELTSKEFDTALRKIFFLLEEMSTITLEAIQTNNPKLLINLHDVDIRLDKFSDYCRRILNKTSNKEPRKSSILFSIISFLELIGDEFKNISTHLLEDFPKAKFKNIEILAESIKEQMSTFESLYYKFSPTKINDLSKIDSKTYLSVPDMYKIATEDEKEIFHHLRMIGRYINSLLELRIEKEF